MSYLMFNMTIEHESDDPDWYNLIPNDHDLDWILIKSFSTTRSLGTILEFFLLQPSTGCTV